MKQSVRVGPTGTRCNPPAHSQHPQICQQYCRDGCTDGYPACRDHASILLLLHDFHPSENGTHVPSRIVPVRHDIHRAYRATLLADQTPTDARPKLVLRQRVQPDIDPAITTAVALDIAG